MSPTDRIAEKRNRFQLKDKDITNIRPTVALLISFVLIAVFLQTAIDRERNNIGLSHSDLRSSTSTVLELLGGLRSTAAAFLWIKVDRIHDTYYGNLSKEDELIPMYRLVTWLNPHIDEAYYVGSFMLYKFKKPDEGWKFNQEGIRSNPQSGKLRLNAALFILSKRKEQNITVKDYKESASLLENALRLGHLEDNDALVAYRELQFSYEQLGLTAKAEETKHDFEIFKSTLE